VNKFGGNYRSLSIELFSTQRRSNNQNPRAAEFVSACSEVKSAIELSIERSLLIICAGGQNMPALSKDKAMEELAAGVEKATATALAEIYNELFPEKPVASKPSAADLAKHVRNGLEAEEIVDLWNVVFPADRNVWYDEEDGKIHFNEEVVGYAETD
jgi:hypothetical protein